MVKNPKRRSRLFKISVIFFVLLLMIFVAYLLTRCFLIKMAYEGTSPIAFLNQMIVGQDLHALDHYYGIADRRFLLLAVGILTAYLFCFLCAAVELRFLLWIFLSSMIGLEIILRVAIFSDHFKIDLLRDASLYAHPSTDNFYKLLNLWRDPAKIIGSYRIHPFLGWSQAAISEGNPFGLSLEARQSMEDNQEKILFYGDSFVEQGLKGLSFVEKPHVPEEKSEKMSVVNLGVSGYGVGQIYLLFRETHHLFGGVKHVIIGCLTSDLDRSLLSLRPAIKPYFVVQNDQLAVKGIPIRVDRYEELLRQRPNIRSYSLQVVLRMFERIFVGDQKGRRIEESKAVNAGILSEITSIAKSEGYPLLFVIFYPWYELPYEGWREQFLKETLRKEKIPFIDTKLILNDAIRKNQVSVSYFYIEDGHHNDLGYEIISDAILEYFKRHQSQTGM